MHGTWAVGRLAKRKGGTAIPTYEIETTEIEDKGTFYTLTEDGVPVQTYHRELDARKALENVERITG